MSTIFALSTSVMLALGTGLIVFITVAGVGLGFVGGWFCFKYARRKNIFNDTDRDYFQNLLFRAETAEEKLTKNELNLAKTGDRADLRRRLKPWDLRLNALRDRCDEEKVHLLDKYRHRVELNLQRQMREDVPLADRVVEALGAESGTTANNAPEPVPCPLPFPVSAAARSRSAVFS